ncbi:hypothetical protein LCGC14_2998020, partial [marine sediment metagenome]
TCTHDLARGASAEDLRDGDGPYPDQHPLLGAGWFRTLTIAAQNRQTDRAQI